MKDKRVLIIAGLVAVLLIAIPLTVYIANQQQEVRSNAQIPVTDGIPTPTNTLVPSPSATPTNQPTSTVAPTPTGAITPTTAGTSCQVPGAVTGVTLDYPYCQGTQCNFTQASCTWEPVNGAVSYTVKVTQVESGAVTKSNTVSAPTVTDSFPVEQGKTYRCDISAVNSCGTSGEVGSAQAVCAVDGIVATNAPTQPPVSQAPTAQQVIPTVVPTGDINTTMLVGIGGIVVTVVGGLLFFFSGI